MFVYGMHHEGVKFVQIRRNTTCSEINNKKKKKKKKKKNTNKKKKKKKKKNQKEKKKKKKSGKKKKENGFFFFFFFCFFFFFFFCFFFFFFFSNCLKPPLHINHRTSHFSISFEARINNFIIILIYNYNLSTPLRNLIITTIFKYYCDTHTSYYIRNTDIYINFKARSNKLCQDCFIKETYPTNQEQRTIKKAQKKHTQLIRNNEQQKKHKIQQQYKSLKMWKPIKQKNFVILKHCLKNPLYSKKNKNSEKAVQQNIDRVQIFLISLLYNYNKKIEKKRMGIFCQISRTIIYITTLTKFYHVFFIIIFKDA
eukprot:TRINITY_DN14369_c0_g2_i4.p1 TRINITY_DN14369_c0_g2~~TRINITY_DN14369_c0_g2_i4.p1  ORF type:complete len:311 (-),score=21.59 TRINITY_DN14369_c0_g2_i4:200-1132(-)